MVVLNGRILDAAEAAFDLSDRGLLLGDGLFETMTAFRGIVHRRAEHEARLAAGLAALGIPLEVERIAETLEAIAPHVPATGGVIRLTVTRGPGPRGLKPPERPAPTVLATVAPWSPDIVFRPVRLAVAEARRNDRSPLARLKWLGYLDAVLAQQAAAGGGFDDALFLNTADRVACSTMANVFAAFGDVLVTPPVSDGVLPGVLRGLVVAAAGAAGFTVREAGLGIEDLAGADAVFLTNSVRFVLPVTALGERALPAGGEAIARRVLDVVLDDVARQCGVRPVV